MVSDESGWDAGTADPALIASMIRNESAGNPRAVSPKGARGLMQIMPATAAQFGVKPDQLFEPKENQWLGTHYYNQLLDHYQGNPFLALVAYHSGPGRVDKGILLPESVKFASKELTGAGGAQSVWQKIKGSFAGGTAYAQESRGAPQPYAQQVQAPTAAPAPSGAAPAAGGGIPLDQFFQQQAQGAAPPSVTPQGGQPIVGEPASQSRMTLHMGPFSITNTPTKLPAQMQQQELSAATALRGIDQAIKYYDATIAPEWAQKYGGSLLTASGRHGREQSFLAQHGELGQMLGMGQDVGGKASGLPDPEIQTFYNMTGPLLAQQMRALVGGRLGYYMITEGPLVPHLPVIGKDSLPGMRAKLGDLRDRTIPQVLQQIAAMKGQGLTEDQIIQSFGGNPGTVPMNPENPGELPQGFQVDQ